MNIKRNIALLFLITFCLITLSGCYSSANLETLAYAVAIRIR